MQFWRILPQIAIGAVYVRDRPFGQSAPQITIHLLWHSFMRQHLARANIIDMSISVPFGANTKEDRATIWAIE